jgi:hypothetical protein
MLAAETLGGGAMAEISIGAAVGEGFGLIRRKPLAVLAWGLCQALMMGLVFGLVGAALLPSYVEMFRQAAAGAQPSPAAMQAMAQGQSVSFLLNFVSLVLNAILWCAVLRAVIHPERGAFAYLRLGMAEILLVFLLIGFVFAFVIASVIVGLGLGILVGVLSLMHAAVVGGILAVVGFLAMLVALIYVGLRVTLIAPILVDTGKLEIGEAWKLTRGKVSSLLAIGLIVFVILTVLEMIVVVLLGVIGFGALSALAGGLANLPTFFRQSPQLWMGRLAPLLAGFGLVLIPLWGCVLAILGAPWGRAYLDLRPRGDIAETFA